MLKKLLAVILALCMTLAVLTACGGETGGGKKDDPATNKDIDKAIDTLEDAGVEIDSDVKDILENVEEAEAADPARIKVTVDLPEGWVEEESKYSNFQAANGTDMIMVTSTKKPSYVDDIMEYAQECLDTAKSVLDDMEFSGIEKVDVDGTEGARYHLDISIVSMKQRQIYYYYFKNGLIIMVQGAYMLSGDADEAASAEKQNEIENLMASVKTEKE